MTQPPTTSPSLLRRLAAWWAHPQLNVWVAGVIAVLFALRKPWALHTPQLWAEDGSIFLTFNDASGAKAILDPYMGYLHLIPRLIAWTPPHFLDPKWWPAFYNGAAFLIALAVILRTFSPRLDLPHKLWLALAFFLGPQTGEVLFTITNLQWFTGILIAEQAFIAAPRNVRDRATDLLIVLVCGLTGPFSIIFWPLLAWRWWRDKTGHNLAVLLVTTACALTQGIFILRTSPEFHWPPFATGTFFTIVGEHLFAWPLVGDHWVMKLPPAVLAIAMIPVIGIVVAAFRPHPLRNVRTKLAIAFLLVLAAGIYRGRPDTWQTDNLIFGERYFYIPRLLLFWLLILEFDAGSRVMAWLARGTAIVIALVHLHHYAVPTPVDYHWAEHCAPIRQGVPANIPILPEGWTLEYRGRRTHP